MIPIKIECGCGQRYAFDVEPVGGRMPSAVACPVCGADGTPAADAVIAQSVPAQPTVAAASVKGVRLRAAAPAPSVQPATLTVSVSGPAPRGAAPRAGQMDRTQVEQEARAKISWGDAPEDVIKYLLMQGFDYEEASKLVQAMFRERAATIRSNGIRKVFTGIALMCVPVVAFLIFASMGILPLKLFAITLMVGVWGAWMLLKGAIMFLAPKSEPGDVAEQ
jgi:hypothetical protein